MLCGALWLRLNFSGVIDVSTICFVRDAHPETFKSAPTAKLLDQAADFADGIPASVTEHTTRHLAETPQPKSRQLI